MRPGSITGVGDPCELNGCANCGVSTYVFDPTVGMSGGLAMRDYNFVAPLERAGEAVTREPDVPVAPK